MFDYLEAVNKTEGIPHTCGILSRIKRRLKDGPMDGQTSILDEVVLAHKN